MAVEVAPYWGERIPLAPWHNRGPGRALGGRRQNRSRSPPPECWALGIRGARQGRGRRSTTTMAPKKVYTPQTRQGSSNQAGTRGEPKNFIPSKNATVTQKSGINFSEGRSAHWALPDRALAGRRQGQAGALAPTPSPTPGKVKRRAGAAWRRLRSTRLQRASSADAAMADMHHRTKSAECLKIAPGQNKRKS